MDLVFNNLQWLICHKTKPNLSFLHKINIILFPSLLPNNIFIFCIFPLSLFIYFFLSAYFFLFVSVSFSMFFFTHQNKHDWKKKIISQNFLSIFTVHLCYFFLIPLGKIPDWKIPLLKTLHLCAGERSQKEIRLIEIFLWFSLVISDKNKCC